jgi:hypothetical protein
MRLGRSYFGPALPYRRITSVGRAERWLGDSLASPRLGHKGLGSGAACTTPETGTGRSRRLSHPALSCRPALAIPRGDPVGTRKPRSGADCALTRNRIGRVRDLRCESGNVHLTVPKHARLRRQKPKWIVIHRGDLPPTDVTTHEGLPVTTVAKSVMDVMERTGRLGLARQALRDARKEGYISASESQQLNRQLGRYEHDRREAQASA